MTFVPGPIIIPRKPKEKPENKKKVEKKTIPRKREKKLVYVLIKLKPEQMISEKAKELEELFKGKTFNRVVNPDEYTLLMNAQNLFSRSSRLYVVELTDEMNRWFYLVPSEERIKFKNKDKYMVFLIKKDSALEEIFKKIAEGKLAKRSTFELVVTAIEVALGILTFVAGYLALENVIDLSQLSNIVTFVLFFIFALQSIKKGYKRRGWED
ncbi:hypothetical protein OCC_04585 [Thermococcus litoralis DSM 5473]|uniref:Uncharacterized protein n=1 Tax=Thermococcus litoralis (strain ATCC 51850 / DSM 5473 / JCM 8560 / NS-C) TaxID=523849 RepID=H3ZPR1_THELN|nr:hypothetical protein [Thermococcus litoralis]EHR78105.1 hypothetical protein OCC_04585 [Thermococcus litoralis DSM 5473]